MTLILTAGCSDFIVQVSDRRFCAASRGGRGVRFIEATTGEGNKELVVASPAADFAVAFTGRAMLGSSGVGDWLVDVVGETTAAAVGLGEYAKQVRHAANAFYQTLPGLHDSDMLEFVFAGFATGDPRPQIILVTNFRSETFEFLGHPTTSFRILRPSNANYPYWEAGYIPAVKPNTKRRIRALVKRSRDYPRTTDAMVREIRHAADHPEYGQWVGKNCMSVVISRDGKREAVYHPAHGDLISYGPNFIQVLRGGKSPLQMSFKNISMGGSLEPMVLGDGKSLPILDRRMLP